MASPKDLSALMGGTGKGTPAPLQETASLKPTPEEVVNEIVLPFPTGSRPKPNVYPSSHALAGQVKQPITYAKKLNNIDYDLFDGFDYLRHHRKTGHKFEAYILMALRNQLEKDGAFEYLKDGQYVAQLATESQTFRDEKKQKELEVVSELLDMGHSKEEILKVLGEDSTSKLAKVIDSMIAGRAEDEKKEPVIKLIKQGKSNTEILLELASQGVTIDLIMKARKAIA